jgi:hypothetical protein
MRATTRSAFLGILTAFAGTPAILAAQQVRLPAVVEYIAGADVYIGAGASQGLAAGDTLAVYASAEGELLGRFVVVNTTAARSLVAFVGPPFAVTRGATLYVERGTARAAAGAPVSVMAEAAAPRSGSRAARSPSLHGRLALEVNAFESTTHWMTDTEEVATRRFATPAMVFGASVTDLPGGWSISTNLRAAYRYSDPEIISPRGALHVYDATVSRTSSTVQFQLGRFTNPFAYGSGWWDGALLHIGGRSGLGVGMAAGFEPERGDQAVATTLPKYSGFVTYRAGNGPVRYSTDVAFQQVRPRNDLDDLPDHSYFTWQQYLRVPGFLVTNDLQVDRDPEQQQWTLTRLNARFAVPVTRGLQLHARVARLQPYAFWRTTDLITSRRDQGALGFSLSGRTGTLGADVTANRYDTGTWGWTYAGSFVLYRTPFFGFDWGASGSYWTRNEFRALYGTSTLTHAFGVLQPRLAYQLYSSTVAGAGNSVTTHTGEVGFSLAISRAVSGTIQGRFERGSNMTSNGVYAGLWTRF